MKRPLLEELSPASLRHVRRGYVVGFGLLVAGALALGVTKAGRSAFEDAGTSLAQAHPGWLLLAAAAFAASLLCAAAAWHRALRACGGESRYADVSARYAVGSLVNAIAPAHVGGAVRLGLLSQTLSGSDRLCRVCGIGSAVAGVRALALAALVVAASAWSAVPFWPAPVLAVAVLVVIGICLGSGSRARGRARSFLQILRVFAASPRTGSAFGGWIAVSVAARLSAAVALTLALGLHSPVTVAVVLLAAIALASVLPLTPGNFGAGAGAVTLALHGTGVGLGSALAVGVAFQAVETFTGVTLGLAGAAALTPPESAVRRWTLATAGATAVLVAAVLGVVSVDLV